MRPSNFSWFDQISDDVLLHILSFVPQQDWHQLRGVCLRFNVICEDKAMLRRTDLSCAYGWSEAMLGQYIRTGTQYIEVFSLNYCHWFTSTFLSSFIPRCKKIQELHLLDCRLTTKGMSRILCSLSCLKSLSISVSNMLDFSNEINSNVEVQQSLKNLQHFCLHIREESPSSGSVSLQFHLSQQTTLIEYCPKLESFCVIGQPGSNQKLSKRLIHPLIVKRENMANLKTMSINCTHEATARLYFFGILIVAFEVPGVHFTNLSVSGLDLIQAVKKSYFIRALQDSCQTLQNLDLSRVHLDDLETSVPIVNANSLQYLNLSDVRSSSSCLGLMKIAEGCPNLVILNLRGATSGHRHWRKPELEQFGKLLKSCVHLKHVNLSGCHVHDIGDSPSLCHILARGGKSCLESLSLPVCCIGSQPSVQVSAPSATVSRGFKRLRLSHYQSQPTPSTSQDTGAGVGIGVEGLEVLVTACPDLSHLELLNAGFIQSVIHVGQKRSMYDPCKESYSLTDHQLTYVSSWINLRHLQLTGLPGVSGGSALEQIGQKCVHLHTLQLAYIGLGSQMPAVWNALQYFKQLLDLRIEQPYLSLDKKVYTGCLGCEKLQRLCIISKKSSIEQLALEEYLAKATKLHMLQLFTDTFLNMCERLQSSLMKRYESVKPGFSVVIHPLQHEKLPHVITDIPLRDLQDLTLLTSKVSTKPLHNIS